MLKEVLDVPAVAKLAADPGSFRNYWRGGTVKVRQLDGRPIRLRPGTSDARVLRHTFQAGAHRAPVSDVSLIWDLGSNIGSTLADMAHRHPGAKIVGVEPDPANHALAVENTSPWSDRVTVLRAAAWTSDGTVSLARDAGREAGSRIAEDGEQVEAVSLNGLLERFGAPSYVKMDVEGAERALLRENTEWAASARSISVELHGSYTAGDCIADLRRLGFSRVWEAEEPWWPRARGRPTVEAVR